MTSRARALALYTPPFVAVNGWYVVDVGPRLVAVMAGHLYEIDRVARAYDRDSYLCGPDLRELNLILDESGASKPGISADEVAMRLTEFWEKQ